MKLGLNQSARMEQRLVQSPQMIQAMQILQLSSLDLEERVEQELVENPFLEEAEQGGEEPTDGLEGEFDGEEQPGLESMIDELERYDRELGDGTRTRTIDHEGADRKLEAMNNTPDRPHSAAEGLVEQLAILDLDEHQREIAEYLIYSLDDRGYLREPLEAVAAQCELEGVGVEELRETLGRIRRIAHPAIGAADLRECLLLQLESHGVEDPLVFTIVDEHLEDITTNRLPRISRATGRSIEDVKDAIEIVRHLDPFPSGDFGGEQAAVIMPDVVVEEREGEFEVRLARPRVRDLTVPSSFRRLLEKGGSSPSVQKWVRKRVESARWFIDAIHQRRSTVLRIAEAVFERQRGFLEKGVRALAPLRMQEIADETGVHISTVSRAVSGKYAQTPRGIFPLKYFFTGGTEKTGGGVASQASIKQRIVELVEAEDGTRPHSDEELSELLEKKDGIKIARRTVTKYRKALDIPSSGQRKQF
jgi:RNA polymerase sigma-54 factor